MQHSAWGSTRLMPKALTTRASSMSWASFGLLGRCTLGMNAHGTWRLSCSEGSRIQSIWQSNPHHATLVCSVGKTIITCLSESVGLRDNYETES